MSTRPIVSAVIASLAFAILALLVQVGIGLLVFSQTTVIVRYVGDVDGRSLFSVSAENASFRTSDQIRVRILNETPPSLMTSSGTSARLARGGRGGEMVLSLGALERGDRVSALLAFEAGSLPQIVSGSGYSASVVGDDKNASIELSNIIWNIALNALVFLFFSYVNATRIADAQKDANKIKDDLDHQKKEIEAYQEKITSRMSFFEQRLARARLIYERRIAFLLRENEFWRKVGRDIFEIKLGDKTSAQEMLERLLTRIGAQRSTDRTDNLNDDEFLDHLTDHSEANPPPKPR